MIIRRHGKLMFGSQWLPCKDPPDDPPPGPAVPPGPPAEPPEPPNADDPPAGETVPRSVYLKLLGEKKAAAAEAKRLKDADKARADQAAKDRGDKDAMIKSRDDEIAAMRSDLDRYRTKEQRTARIEAFETTLGKRLDPKILPLVKLDQIVLDEEGNVDQTTVESYVRQFKGEYGDMLAALEKKPNTPPGKKPEGTTGKISYEQWLAKPYKEREAFDRSMIIGFNEPVR